MNKQIYLFLRENNKKIASNVNYEAILKIQNCVKFMHIFFNKYFSVCQYFYDLNFESQYKP